MNKHILQKNKAGVDGPGRRQFLKVAGMGTLGLSVAGLTAFKGQGVSIIVDPADSIAASKPAIWAIKQLTDALTAQQITVEHCKHINETAAGNLCIIASGSQSLSGKSLLKTAKANIPAKPEAQGLIPTVVGTRQVLLASGHDERGLVYALLELADRVTYSSAPLGSLHLTKAIIEQPTNKVRSLNRLFVSDVEDKPWFNDREMWPKYLDMVTAQRFNRFNLSLGIGYDFLKAVTDAYFIFAYPFFLSVPGYNVHVPQLPAAERDSNLAMLKYISEQTVARGLEFRLGLWMHGYEWANSPNPNYTIAGLTKETHAVYCRDALRMLLQACPAISGITFRVHGESGVTEGSYDFWKTIFDGVSTCGRLVEIDMHSKGIDQQMLDTALSAKVPVTVSPKFWAEHMGMPYHQADIRQLEMPKAGKVTSGLMNLSDGTRSFMRYGYGDLLKEDRKYAIVHRIWPGTQRLLLWGDPHTAAAQSRQFNFCGSAGVELMEPLSFKGRRGSGIAGDRCGYADASLKPKYDWEKYQYSLRVFGRTLYNPETSHDVWRRYLSNQFGEGAEGVEQALSYATRILPTITVAHSASAGNNNYWPEMYTNMPISNAALKHPYTDSPTPKVFGNVSPLDPQLFLTINEHAKELLSGNYTGKYTPIEVAQWLENHATAAETGLQQSATRSIKKSSPEYRRMAIDVAIQAGIGRFFAAKFRAGVLFGVYEQNGDRAALEASLKLYRTAREHWAKLADIAKDVYKKDVTAGELTWLRGHWLDRLPDMDADIDHMAKRLDATKTDGTRSAMMINAVNACLGKPERIATNCYHKPQARFKAGLLMDIQLTFDKTPASVRLYYRHVNQGERYQSVDMTLTGNNYKAVIPADYTNSPYPMAYYFEVRHAPDKATIYPGFGAGLTDQPYFVVREG